MYVMYIVLKRSSWEKELELVDVGPQYLSWPIIENHIQLKYLNLSVNEIGSETSITKSVSAKSKKLFLLEIFLALRVSVWSITE